MVTLETSIYHSINWSWDQFIKGSQNGTFNPGKMICQVVEYDFVFAK